MSNLKFGPLNINCIRHKSLPLTANIFTFTFTMRQLLVETMHYIE